MENSDSQEVIAVSSHQSPFGSSATITQLYDAYGSDLHIFVAGLLRCVKTIDDPLADAEDIVALLGKELLRQFDSARHPWPWLMKIARNQTLDWVKKERRRRTRESASLTASERSNRHGDWFDDKTRRASDYDPHVLTGLEILIQQETCDAIMTAVEELPHCEREMARLILRDQYSVTEASMMIYPSNPASGKSCWQRARTRLRLVLVRLSQHPHSTGL
jgi:DNA-directed RNA polymerase specialized sigma24 family protein